MTDMTDLTFEAAYAELERIITQLDRGDLPLEESVALYERGRKLTEYCQGLLDAAELRVRRLDDDGDLEPLE